MPGKRIDVLCRYDEKDEENKMEEISSIQPEGNVRLVLKEEDLMKYTVLVAEDDKDIANLLKLYLTSSGYEVMVAGNGQDAYDMASENPPDIGIFDIMMDKMNGYELTMKLREKYSFPIIFLSAKNMDSDKILGLDLGADDYMTKPFNPLEVVARVKSNLRRYYDLKGPAGQDGQEEDSEREILKVKDLVLDKDGKTVTQDGKELVLTSTEFKILALLMKEPGRVFTKQQICENVIGDYFQSDDNSIMVHISNLRDKLGDDFRHPKYIRNIRGLGYKIEKDS